MTGRVRTLLVLIMTAGLAAPMGAQAAGPHLVIVGGLGGEDYYAGLFHRWTESLAAVGTQQLGIAPEQLIRLEADPSHAAHGATGVSRKENVLETVHRLAQTSEAGDVVALVLLGHGTARGNRAMFNLPGPDLSAVELASALDALADRTVVVVVAAPASAPFIDRLSGPDRVVITATATAAENQHTRFGGHFIDALADNAADSNKDGRVSLLEAFQYATGEVQRAFETEGLLRTEHAMLDDNGDGDGSRDPGDDAGDGALAARIHLAAPAHRPDSVAGRAALALEIEARDLVDRIEALKRDKRTLERDDYLARLESLLVALAINRRAYREME